MIAQADLAVGMRVVVVSWHGHESYFCGHCGEVVAVIHTDPAIKYITPDVRVKLDEWPRPVGFWTQELTLEGGT